MNIQETFNDFTMFLNENYDSNTMNLLIGFIGITLFIVVLRIIITSGYQSQYMIFLHRSKKSKDKIEVIDEKAKEISDSEKKSKAKVDSKFGLIGKVMNDYKKSLDCGLRIIDTKSIINKHMLKLNFIGWAFYSMENFVLSFEFGILIIGLLMTVFLETKTLFAITTIAIFILVKILASVFDFSLVKEKLICELAEYVERDTATVNTLDLNDSISKMRIDMYTAIVKQGDTLKESVDKLGSNLTGALALSVSEMTKSVEASVNKASHFTEDLERPLHNWMESINNASMAQEKINLAFDSLSNMVESLNVSSKYLGDNFNIYFDNIQSQTQSVNSNVGNLINLVDEFKELNSQNKVDYEAISKELTYIEKNQSLLEGSLQHYETALENITSKLGDAFGSMVDLQMQNSYNKLNQGLEDNINKIILSNNDLIRRLHGLFDDMQDQTKNQTQAIVKVKEQMDMQFDIIREKI